MMKTALLSVSLIAGITAVKAQCETFHANFVTDSTSCADYADGVLTVNPLDGTAPYDIDIYNAAGALINPFGATTLDDLVSGWYYIDIHDYLGCPLEDSVFIGSPEPLSADYTVTEPTAGDTYDGSIQVDAVYGTYDTLIYYWAPNPSCSVGPLLSEANWGHYILVITNENDCFANYDIDLAIYWSLDENSLNDLFTVSASSDKLNVNNGSYESAVFRLYSVSGQLMTTQKLMEGQNMLKAISTKGLFIYTIEQDGAIVGKGKIVMR